MARSSKPFTLTETEQKAMNGAAKSFRSILEVKEYCYGGRLDNDKELSDLHKSSEAISNLLSKLIYMSDGAAGYDALVKNLSNIKYADDNFRPHEYLGNFLEASKWISAATKQYSRQGRRSDQKMREWVYRLAAHWQSHELKVSNKPNSRFVRALMEHTPPDLPQVGSVDLVKSVLAGMPSLRLPSWYEEGGVK